MTRRRSTTRRNVKLRDVVEAMPPVIILAGGLGTRLRSAYASGPKSMAPISGRPFLDYLVRWLRSEGVRQVVLCIGYKGGQIRRWLGSGKMLRVQAKYSVEKKLLGTAGAVRKGQNVIRSPRFIVVNGDTMLVVNLRKMLEFHIASKALATVAAVATREASRYGTLLIGKSHEVKQFREKQPSRGVPGKARQYINGGVYILERSIISKINPRTPTSLEKQVLPTLASSKRLFAYETSGYFLDIGVPDDFDRAQSELPKLKFGNDPDEGSSQD